MAGQLDRLPAFPSAQRVDLPGGGWLSAHVQTGAGPCLIFLHGLTDCAHSFQLLLPHLPGRHIVMFDLRGHGASFRADITALDDLAADVTAAARVMRLPPAVVLGHSMGALVAVLLASRHPLPMLGMVLLSGSLQPASPTLSDIARQVAALPDPLPPDAPFLAEWYHTRNPVPPAFTAKLKAACTGMRRADWLRCLALLGAADLTLAAGSISVPGLILHGTDDPLFPPSHLAQTAHCLPLATRLVIANTGHNPHWEKPGEVAAAVEGLLAACPGYAPHG